MDNDTPDALDPVRPAPAVAAGPLRAGGLRARWQRLVMWWQVQGEIAELTRDPELDRIYAEVVPRVMPPGPWSLALLGRSWSARRR